MVEVAERRGGQDLAALMQEMGINAASVERRRQIVGLTPADIDRITAIKGAVLDRVDELGDAFFDYMRALDEGRVLLDNRDALKRARALKREHLTAMVSGPYDVGYVEQRLQLAGLYSRIGLEPRVFLGAFKHLLHDIGAAIVKRAKRAPVEAFESFLSLEKVAFLDVGVIVDALSHERERVIRQQQDAIRELSTPVLQIRDRMLLLPIIGVIDTRRAQAVTENLLRSIRASRAKVVVMDVTGVAAIDSRVANHLLQTVAAAKLMGARVVVTGLSSEVAQSLVALGIDVDRFNTVGDLQGGLEEAERVVGYRVDRRTSDDADDAANA